MCPPASLPGTAAGRSLPRGATGQRLVGTWCEKPWGMHASPFFGRQNHTSTMGELQFSPPVELPFLLVKYLCAGTDISVQIHPTAQQAAQLGLGTCGKDECWIILHAEAGARIGLGLRQTMDRDEFCSAVKSGAITDLIETIPVKQGDLFYIPANTIHTVGAGITLLEIQQNSDITFRLHDFGRTRPLHLMECIAYARRVRHALRHRQKNVLSASARLVGGPFFTIFTIHDGDVRPLQDVPAGPLLTLPLTGPLSMGSLTLNPGECAMAQDWRHIGFPSKGACILVFPPTN